jgi:hypothetical protein
MIFGAPLRVSFLIGTFLIDVRGGGVEATPLVADRFED